MSRTVIKIDNAFDKFLTDHVTKNGRRTLCLSIRGSQAVLSGEENSVELAMENLENMTVSDLLEAMKLMDHEEEEMRYKSTEKVKFPAMKVKFKGRLWTLQKARDQLSIYLNILGFGKGGTKKFKVVSDEPDGWPDEQSFEAFEHPSYANMSTVNDIIESLLKYHGFDAKTHPFIVDEPKTPPPKKRKRKEAKKTTFEEDEDDENDANENSFNMNDDNKDQVKKTDNDPKKRKLCPYEELREKNIEERDLAMRSAGLLPHSKIRKIWETKR